MARYYLVQYVKRPDGLWQSPPECEDAWNEGCFFQTRFDNDSHVCLVTCMSDTGLPEPAKEVTLDEGLAWVATLKPRPKSGPTIEDKGAPVVLMTPEEDQSDVKRTALGWTNKDMLAFALRRRAL